MIYNKTEDIEKFARMYHASFHDSWQRTVFMDRYGGVYSGGEWVAMAWDHAYIPEDFHFDDMTCEDAFETLGKDYYGVGSTPGEALADLDAKVKETIHSMRKLLTTPMPKEIKEVL